jgi:hypothetical protein
MLLLLIWHDISPDIFIAADPLKAELYTPQLCVDEILKPSAFPAAIAEMESSLSENPIGIDAAVRAGVRLFHPTMKDEPLPAPLIEVTVEGTVAFSTLNVPAGMVAAWFAVRNDSNAAVSSWRAKTPVALLLGAAATTIDVVKAPDEMVVTRRSLSADPGGVSGSQGIEA